MCGCASLVDLNPLGLSGSSCRWHCCYCTHCCFWSYCSAALYSEPALFIHEMLRSMSVDVFVYLFPDFISFDSPQSDWYFASITNQKKYRLLYQAISQWKRYKTESKIVCFQINDKSMRLTLWLYIDFMSYFISWSALEAIDFVESKSSSFNPLSRPPTLETMEWSQKKWSPRWRWTYVDAHRYGDSRCSENVEIGDDKETMYSILETTHDLSA